MKQVLVVEDDDGTREAIVELLREARYWPLAAADGKEALDRLRRSRPDLLLLDLVLPRVDGWQLIEQIRADGAHSDLPVVVMTAWPHASDFPAGVVVVRKPFEWQTLLGAMRRLCGAPIAKCPSPPVQAELAR